MRGRATEGGLWIVDLGTKTGIGSAFWVIVATGQKALQVQNLYSRCLSGVIFGVWGVVLPAVCVAAKICEINRVEIVQNGFPNTKSREEEVEPSGNEPDNR